MSSVASFEPNAPSQVSIRSKTGALRTKEVIAFPTALAMIFRLAFSRDTPMSTDSFHEPTELNLSLDEEMA